MGLFGGLGRLVQNVGDGIGDVVHNPIKAVKDGLNDKATLTGLAALAGGYGLYNAGLLGGAGGAAGAGLSDLAAADAAAGLMPEFGTAAGYSAGIGQALPAAASAAAGASGGGSGLGSLLSSFSGGGGGGGGIWGTAANLLSGALQSNAASKASQAQSDAAMAGIDEQRRQFDTVRASLAPYMQAGTGALTGQQDLLGLNGAQAQQAALDSLQSSPMFSGLVKQGENAILANASATGGLRGGNVQGALAQFRPQMLQALIDQQYARLGGLSGMGQSSAAGVGNAALSTGNQVSNLLQQQGSAQAGGALAQGRIGANLLNGFAQQWGFGQALPQRSVSTSPTNAQLEQQYYLGGP